MDFYQTKFENIVIKFCEKLEYAEDIAHGNIYMKSSGYFRQLEDNYRGDIYDGRIHVEEEFATVPLQFGDGRVCDTIIMTDDVYGLPNNDKIPIFCASLVSAHIVDPISKDRGAFCKEFVKEIRQFGQYAVCFSLDEFIDKAIDYAVKKDFLFQFGKISYISYNDIFPATYNKDHTGIRLGDFYGIVYKNFGKKIEGIHPFHNANLMLFQKNPSYIWQNEWRFVLTNEKNDIVSETEDHHIMCLGKLTSAKICRTDDIIDSNIVFDKL